MMCIPSKETPLQQFERIVREDTLPAAKDRLERIIREQSLTEEGLFGEEE